MDKLLISGQNLLPLIAMSKYEVFFLYYKSKWYGYSFVEYDLDIQCGHLDIKFRDSFDLSIRDNTFI